jgi:hypothetical protein
VPVSVSFDGADRAYHYARPAADAFFQVDYYVSGSLILANAARNAGQRAYRFFTMAALDGNRPDPAERSTLIDRLNMDSRVDCRIRPERIQEVAAGCMRSGACQFTGSAGQALFYFTKDSLHDASWRLRAFELSGEI